MILSKGNRSVFGQTPQRLAVVVLALFSGLLFSKPALAADITVGSPVNGTNDTSPVWIRAHNIGCDGLAPTNFGYSLDNSSALNRGTTNYDVDVIRHDIGAGSHTIHFKSWTTKGACPMVSTTFKVVASTGSSSASSGSSSAATSSAATSSIPSSAIATASLDSKPWTGDKDSGTPGSAHGSTVYPSTISYYDNARKFYMTYSARAGYRWHYSFAKSTTATHFVYDTYVYLANPSQVANLELDMNQVMSNGKTVIFGAQCTSYSGTWEYTLSSGSSHWHRSNVPCNPKNWAAKTWHHVQIASHRNSTGYVTYDWVNVDGAHHVFQNASGNGARSMGWSKGTLLLNFQLGGASKGSGSITAYIHKMTVFRW
jgi:hypothetical protein